MADPSETPGFLILPFDWYILEKWRSSDPLEESSERRQSHLELGIAYAAIGHEGRRPYAQKAFSLRIGDLKPNDVPRPVTEVPQDLLTANERRVCNLEYTQNRLWIRTDYSKGTDEHFQELVQAFPDAIDYYMNVMQDQGRYASIQQDFRSLFAFFPALLDVDATEYLDDFHAFDAEEVQNELFLADRADGIADEDRQSCGLSHFFIADAETMRTRFVRWVVPDQYGSLLFDERIQPWSLIKLQGLITGAYRSLQEFRDEASRGWYGNDPRRSSSSIVGPWEPPA